MLLVCKVGIHARTVVRVDELTNRYALRDAILLDRIIALFQHELDIDPIFALVKHELARLQIWYWEYAIYVHFLVQLFTLECLKYRLNFGRYCTIDFHQALAYHLLYFMRIVLGEVWLIDTISLHLV